MELQEKEAFSKAFIELDKKYKQEILLKENELSKLIENWALIVIKQQLALPINPEELDNKPYDDYITEFRTKECKIKKEIKKLQQHISRLDDNKNQYVEEK